MAFYGRLISSTPFIMLCGTGNGMLGAAWPMQDSLPDKCFILINFWTHFDIHTSSNLLLELKDYQERYPNRKFLFLANELTQLEELRRTGIAAVMGNHNIFMDENIFRPKEAERLRRFDGIYNARMNPEKRHELCADLRSVGFIYYFNPPNEFSWFERTRAQLPNATFLNGDPRDKSYHHFTPEQCADVYNYARVGLCLSETEGAMMSSMEYLMCGIPVVTTPNLGGRNHFFRSEYAIMAEPTSNSVAECVDILIRREIDPQIIRQRVLELVFYERERFFRDVQEWLATEGLTVDFARAFRSRYINRMWETFDSVQDFNTRNENCF